MSKYSIILADCPWSYRNGNVPQGGVNHQYPTMNIEDIAKLPINKISAEICVLFLWATFPKLEDALYVIKNWGFEYKTLGFSWIKLNKDSSPFFGVGYYAKSNCEVCLMGTKGNVHPLVKSNKVSSVILHPKTKHSEKPAIIRDKIVELFGDLPRIELFARQKVNGWHSWGNEVQNDIDLHNLQKT